jgi:sulfite exporter TauE/SafE
MAPPLSFAGGLLLGFASSLHCVGMCGGIALLLGRPAAASPRPLIEPLALHAGRITAYMALGGLAGTVGSAALGGLDGVLAHQLLRWAAAMTLAWVGLSTMGLMPSPALIGHAVQARLPRPALALRLPGELRGYAAGLGWGLMPCGMVYGALLYAMFAGSLPGGMLVMAGFGLGTLPALLAVSSGSAALSALARRPAVRWIAGVVILLLAGLSLLPGEASLLAYCRS